MPRFPVGNLANINLAARHGWNFGAALLIQDLDTPYSGSGEIPNLDGRRTRQQTLLLQAEFGLSDRWALGATLPLRHAKAEGRTDLDTSGLGDIEILLRYAAFPLGVGRKASLNLLGGIGLPTGRSEGMLAALETIQFGVGNFTAIAGFEWSYRARPGITAFFRSRAGWVLGANDDGYRFGDSFDNAAGATILLRSPNLRIITYVSTLHLEQDRQDGEPVQSRGGGGSTAQSACTQRGWDKTARSRSRSSASLTSTCGGINWSAPGTFSWGMTSACRDTSVRNTMAPQAMSNEVALLRRRLGPPLQALLDAIE